jgi:hypothetical protein
MSEALSESRTGRIPATPAERPQPQWRAPFAGLAIAALLLAGIEAFLHTDSFLYRYRSVFAAGRAMDKLLALEAKPRAMIALGNSRVDNGFHPEILEQETGLEAFNLGLPGAEACNMEGVVARLAARGSFGQGRIEQVLFGLDEGFLQRTGGLGYEVFFDKPARLLDHGRYTDWLRSRLRLWGYTDSLRTLQEPAKLIRFIEASSGEVESWGGSARHTSGFRAADEVTNQDAARIAEQNRSTRHPPPDPEVLECLWATIEQLQASNVAVNVFLTPSLRGANPFAGQAGGPGSPYARVKDELLGRGVKILEFDVDKILDGKFFANPGHLNRAGAERFTRALAAKMKSTALPDSAD